MASRTRFPPGGWRYYVPETKWSISPWISFEAAVGQIIQHRQGNQFLTQKNGWSLNPAIVAEELDAFNAAVCQQMGWKDYITEGGVEATPNPKHPSSQSLFKKNPGVAARVSTGIQTLAAWEIAGGNLVPRELSEKRAKICASRENGRCPKNVSGDLLTWFTAPAADLIRKQLESRNNLKIFTTQDPLLGVCEACSCPLKLKAHTPIDIILSHMSADVKAALDTQCWILEEERNGQKA